MIKVITIDQLIAEISKLYHPSKLNETFDYSTSLTCDYKNRVLRGISIYPAKRKYNNKIHIVAYINYFSCHQPYIFNTLIEQLINLNINFSINTNKIYVDKVNWFASTTAQQFQDILYCCKPIEMFSQGKIVTELMFISE